jgi:hypothetical protein
MLDADGKRLVDNGTIQCMLRWRSEEALRIYGRMNPSTYGGLLQKAVLADVSSVRTTNSHLNIVYDADDRATQLQRGLPQLYAAARAEEEGPEDPLEDIDDSLLNEENL